MNKIKIWTPPAIWAILILAVSSIPNIKIPGPEISLDKIAHFAEYFILGLLLLISFLKHNELQMILVKHQIITLIIIGFFLSASDELHQRFIPGRYPDIFDFLFDFAGVLASIPCRNILMKTLFNRSSIMKQS